MIYHVPSDLAWVIDETDVGEPPAVYLMNVPDGVPLVLTDTAALIWLFAAQGDDVTAALAEVVEDPPADLAQTTAAYLDDLVARGLLVKAESGTGIEAESSAADRGAKAPAEDSE